MHSQGSVGSTAPVSADNTTHRSSCGNCYGATTSVHCSDNVYSLTGLCKLTTGWPDDAAARPMTAESRIYRVITRHASAACEAAG